MNVSQISLSDQSSRNAFIRYANMFMGTKSPDEEASTLTPVNPDKKDDKIKGLETLTIFPKEIIDGKMVITA